jgi:hypothetical protein
VNNVTITILPILDGEHDDVMPLVHLSILAFVRMGELIDSKEQLLLSPLHDSVRLDLPLKIFKIF